MRSTIHHHPHTTTAANTTRMIHYFRLLVMHHPYYHLQRMLSYQQTSSNIRIPLHLLLQASSADVSPPRSKAGQHFHVQSLERQPPPPPVLLLHILLLFLLFLLSNKHPLLLPPCILLMPILSVYNVYPMTFSFFSSNLSCNLIAWMNTTIPMLA